MMEAEPEKTMPRSGLVSQIRQNWSVFEDEALAQQMQQQEISEHLGGNRVRNKILREDIPLSRQEQQMEEQQATADLQQTSGPAVGPKIRALQNQLKLTDINDAKGSLV